jgi:hypothetical protein
MALPKCTTVRRPTCTLVAGAVVVASLGVVNSGPAWGQDTGDAGGASANPFPANTFHAFLLDDGEFITIDPPGASGALTTATEINNREQIRGYYLDAGGIAHGFLRDRKGVFTPIDHPDGPLATVALDINKNRGQIVGAYTDAEETTHGFLLDKGVFTTIDPRTPRLLKPAASTTVARL